MGMRITDKQKAYVRKVAEDSVANQRYYRGEVLPLDEFFALAPRDVAFWNEHFRRKDVTEENVSTLNELLATYYSEALLGTEEESSTQALLTDEELTTFFEHLMKQRRDAAS